MNEGGRCVVFVHNVERGTPQPPVSSESLCDSAGEDALTGTQRALQQHDLTAMQEASQSAAELKCLLGRPSGIGRNPRLKLRLLHV